MGAFQNEAPKWIFIAMWAGTQLGLFGYYFWFYYTDDQFHYTRRILGLGLPFARGPANCLNFNCMLILLPVCRNLISFVRSVMCRCLPKSMRRLMDKNITFHKFCAYAICFWTAMHTLAHCYNAEFFSISQGPPPKPSTDSTVSVYELSARGNTSCPKTGTGEWLNPVCTSSTDSYTVIEALKIYPALSGVIITLALIIIVLTATEFIRRSYFEIFWVTHHLFVVFFAFLVSHGFRGVVRTQVNLDKHDISFCPTVDRAQWGPTPIPDSDGVNRFCESPVFQSSTPSTWYWVIAPMVLYVIERIIRIFRSFQTVVISKVVKHPSRVIELQMKKSGFKMEAGQYIFLKCPSLSRLEWHPFTLTSSPDEDFFSVHIRIAGDWTAALAKTLNADGKEAVESYKLPAVAVDGPFGTASEDWDQYEVDILVGAGIGVTPFASIMKHMWYTYQQNKNSIKLKKVYFYWICPDTNAFEWFSDLLHHLEEQMRETGYEDFLTHNIYLTRGWDVNFARNIALNEEEEQDAITGLQQKTHYGRPNWDQIFKSHTENHEGEKIGVFFCGPAVLSKTLHQMSNKYSNTGGTQFVYNKENF